MSYDPQTLARAVREQRKAAGFTQAELAERAELAFETVSRVESGREPPSLRTAVRLADALGLPLDVVVGRTKAAAVSEVWRTGADVRRLVELVQRLDPKAVKHLLAFIRALAQPRSLRPTRKGQRA